MAEDDDVLDRNCQETPQNFFLFNTAFSVNMS